MGLFMNMACLNFILLWKARECMSERETRSSHLMFCPPGACQTGAGDG